MLKTEMISETWPGKVPSASQTEHSRGERADLGEGGERRRGSRGWQKVGSFLKSQVVAGEEGGRFAGVREKRRGREGR